MSAQVGGRGLIHKGDSTTTGGVVTQGLGNVMLVGEGATQIEMLATCPICEKGWGKIVPIEKWDVFIDNVQAALDGDLVMCGCPEGSNTLIASADTMRFSKVDGQIHGFKPHASTQEMDATYQSMVNALAEEGSAAPPSSPASRQGAQELKSKPEVVKALRLKSPLLKQSLTLDKLANRESHSYKSGARGQEVEYIQQALIKLGFDLGNAGADGDFGPTTKRQVEQFQKEYQETNNTHLAYQVGTIDGIVGQGTLLGLDEALVEGWVYDNDEMDLKWLIVPKGQLTFDAEGNDIDSSIYFSRTIHWPGGNSGVTIGRGYDCGNRSQHEILEDLTKSGINQDIANAIARSAELKGKTAKAFVENSQGKVANITRKDQYLLFVLIYRQYEQRAIKNYDKWTKKYAKSRVDWPNLDNKIRDVLVDFVYQGFTRGPKPMTSGMMNDKQTLIEYIEGSSVLSSYEPGRQRANYLRN